MERSFSVSHTVAAAVVTVVGYFLLLYYVTPIAEWAIELYGRWFVPERYGGGSEASNPGILTLLGRVVMLSALAAWAALAASFWLFENAHARTVAVALTLGVVAWVGYLFNIGFPTKMSLASSLVVLTIVLTAAPPAYFAYSLWRDEGWS